MKSSIFIAPFSKACAFIFTIGVFNPSIAAQPQPIKGITFSHHDWEMACDNTGTCRAAGYSTEYDESGVSVLLTRAAGAGHPIRGELLFRDDENVLPAGLQMYIGDRSYGKVDYTTADSTPLSDAQVQALLNSAKTNKAILFSDGALKFTLSNQGMSAVFLKMDDFQRRVGTPGAIMRKGNRPESDVLQPQPLPVLTIPPTQESNEELKRHYMDRQEKLKALLAENPPDNEEFGISDDDDERPLDVYPLNERQALVSQLCWLAAYNAGYCFWLVDKELTSAELITSDASDYEQGQIRLYHKGRGIGDCWSMEDYSWDGREFINTQTATSGMCRGQAGGFWTLPTLSYTVVRAQ